MRIAILADPIDNQNAGIHVFTREMVNAMIRNNPGHEILLIREKYDPELAGTKQVAIGNTRLPIGFASLRLFFLVPLVLQWKKADIVIEPAHFGPFNLLPSVKRVTIIHDLTPILFPHLHRWHSQFLQRVFLKSILNKTDVIIANSDNTVSDLCKVYPANCDKVNKIYPGRGAQFKHQINPDVLKKYHITGIYFLYVGTIEPRKNLTVLLEAFRLFHEKTGNQTKLVIAGNKGWKSSSFFDALKSHPYKNLIICTGFVDDDDLPVLYTHAIALVYPSLYEGFGLPIIEAMSCGTPVIAADNSSLHEAGGEAALYFDARDASNLLNQMMLLTSDEDLRHSLSEKSLSHAANFNWNTFAVSLWNLLLEKR